jgi:hypothetical protein
MASVASSVGVKTAQHLVDVGDVIGDGAVHQLLDRPA